MLTDSDESASPLPGHAWDVVLADPPWKDKSFLASVLATIVGIASWIGNVTSPAVAQLGGSFLGGFLIGWVFRRFLSMAALIAGIILAGLAVLKATGWISLDWTSLDTQVSQSLRWLQGEADGLRKLLAGYLPSSIAGWAGAMFGIRKK